MPLSVCLSLPVTLSLSIAVSLSLVLSTHARVCVCQWVHAGCNACSQPACVTTRNYLTLHARGVRLNGPAWCAIDAASGPVKLKEAVLISDSNAAYEAACMDTGVRAARFVCIRTFNETRRKGNHVHQPRAIAVRWPRGEGVPSNVYTTVVPHICWWCVAMVCGPVRPSARFCISYFLFRVSSAASILFCKSGAIVCARKRLHLVAQCCSWCGHSAFMPCMCCAACVQWRQRSTATSKWTIYGTRSGGKVTNRTHTHQPPPPPQKKETPTWHHPTDLLPKAYSLLLCSIPSVQPHARMLCAGTRAVFLL